MTLGPAAAGADRTVPERLLTVPFVAVCIVSFFTFSQNYLIQPVLPLWILELGGNAAVVGLIGAAFSVSSFVLRPFIGRLVDQWSVRRVLLAGACILGLSGFGYLGAGLLILALARSLHGIGWAAMNTAGNVSVAALAPPARRGEAGGYYASVPGIAQAVMPALGLAILPVAGFTGAFVVAGVLGFAAALFVPAIRLPAVPRKAVATDGFWRGLLDPVAFGPLILEVLGSSAFTLFTVFVPLYARDLRIPVESLGVYYLAIGLTILFGRIFLGRLSDRIGRGPVIAIGGVAAIAGIATMWLADSIVLLTVSGFAFGLGLALISPTTFAMVADRADPARRGAAMATYSMAFQIANAVGGTTWGVLITLSGFPAAFAAAIVAEGLLIVVATRLAIASRRSAGEPRAG